MERVRCESCGYEFEVEEGGAGQVSCPNCGSVVIEHLQSAVPVPDAGSEEGAGSERTAESETGESPPPDAAEAESPASLSLREEAAGIQPGKECPNCGSEVAADATLCVNCGYDFQTGRLVTQARERSFAGRAAAFFITGIVVGAVAGFLLGRSPAKRPASREPVKEAAGTSPSSAPVQPGDTASVAESGSVEPPPGEAPGAVREMAEEEAAAMGGEPSPSSELSTEERIRLRERIEHRLTKWLAEKYPPFQKDEEAALRLRSGIVYRGRFLGVKEDVVVIVRDGQPLEIPLADLDRPSRLRSDSSFRRKYLEYAVNRYEQRLSQQGEKATGK